MTFKLEINCDNAAFDNLPEELEAIFLDVVQQVDKGERMAYVSDTNGNRVGHFEFKGKREE